LDVRYIGPWRSKGGPGPLFQDGRHLPSLVLNLPGAQEFLPKLFNLRSDPFESADHEGMDY